MIIYNSMIIWVAIIGIIYNFIHPEHRIEQRDSDKVIPVPLIWAVITFVYIVLWCGLRSGVADTGAYIGMFNNQSNDLSQIKLLSFDNQKSPVFTLSIIIFKRFISQDYHIWLMTIAIITAVPIMHTLRKHSVNFFYSVFLFLVTTEFFWMFNGMRQFLAVAILFGVSDWISEKKMIRLLCVLLLLITIHSSAIIMLPIFFVVRGNPFGKKTVLFMLIVLAAVLFIQSFPSTFSDTLESTFDKGTAQQFAQDDGVNPIRVLVMSVPPVIAFLNRQKILEKNNVFLNVCVNMSIICASLYFLGIFTSGILVGRLPIYCEIYNLILIPYLFDKFYPQGTSRWFYIIATVLYLIFYFVSMNGVPYGSDYFGWYS